MHLKSFPALIVAALVAVAPAISLAADKKAPAPTPTESEAIAKARLTYPMKTCLVSDEALGDINEATPYIYHQAGKPDRILFVCCEGCIDDFKVDPAKYLKKLDDAAAGKKSAPAKKDGHDHDHDKKH